MLNVLLSGGAGYIGSHTAKLLAAAGIAPIVLDNLSTGNRQAVKWGPLIEGDIRDCSLIAAIVRKYQISAVLHFAASAHVGESMRAPIEYFDNNVVASLEFLRAVLSAGVNRVVFSSSCAIYGEPVSEYISETDAQVPMNPYGESKLVIEKALRWYDHAYGLKSVCLRYFNAAGADPQGEIGESHQPETHLVPCAIQAALGLRSHLDLLGDDYPTPDGTAIRDFVHVNDIARGHLLALRDLMGEGASKSLNLGSGTGYSVKKVIETVEAVSGREVPVRVLSRRAGDPARLVADASLAYQTLQWTASASDLENVVRTAWAWHESQQFCIKR